VATKAEVLRERFYPEERFGGFTDVDGAITFYMRVCELLPPDGVALDVGCGRGTQGEDPVRTRRDLRILRGRCRQVIGIDVDAAAAVNPFIDEFRVIAPGAPWPVESNSIDLCLADFVVEHVEDPDAFVAECARVLRLGGALCIRTVNVNSYLGLASRLLPGRLHARALLKVQPERRSDDVFPTRYRANTRKTLSATLSRHGFDAAVYGYEAEPGYMAFSALAYRAGVLHARYAPKALRVGLLAFGQLITSPT
jgi:SAM-dependent methyltransferase